MSEESILYIGKKPVMSYVLAAVPRLKTNGQISIKARGRSISKAVDVSLILRDRFVKDCEIGDISIRTEVLNDDGEEVKVSSVEILICRNHGPESST